MKLKVKKVKDLMYKHSLNQTALAKKINISRTSITLILNEKKNPRKTTVEKIAKALGIEIEEIIKEE